MQHTYRYLQQATIPPVKEWNIEKGLLGNLDFAYMGSAEFEFGAIPDTIARLLTDTEPKVMGKVEVALPKNYLRASGTVMTTVRYCVRQSQEVQLIELLKNWKTASRHFKEWNVDLSQSGDFVIVTDVFDFPITKQINRHELPEAFRDAFKKQAITVYVEGVTKRDGELYPTGTTQLNLKEGQEQAVFHSLEIMPEVAPALLQTNTDI